MSVTSLVIRNHQRHIARVTAVAIVLVGIVIGVAVAAYATVSSGNASISATSSSYQTVTTYWHRSSGATSFWNDGSAKTVDVKVSNGTKHNYATLSSGQWQGWTSANSPIGNWTAYAKADAPVKSGSNFNLAYSIVHKAW